MFFVVVVCVVLSNHGYRNGYIDVVNDQVFQFHCIQENAVRKQKYYHIRAWNTYKQGLAPVICTCTSVTTQPLTCKPQSPNLIAVFLFFADGKPRKQMATTASGPMTRMQLARKTAFRAGARCSPRGRCKAPWSPCWAPIEPAPTLQGRLRRWNRRSPARILLPRNRRAPLTTVISHPGLRERQDEPKWTMEKFMKMSMAALI